MTFNCLPADLLLMIADHVGSVSTKDLDAMTRTSPKLYIILNHTLYRKEVLRGGRALIWAIRKASIETLRHLIEAGADINAIRDRFGQSPLIVALMVIMQSSSYLELSNRQAIALQLIHLGANIEAKDRMERSALQLAVSGPYVPVIQLLLRRGVDSSPLVSLMSEEQKARALRILQEIRNTQLCPCASIHCDADLTQRLLVMLSDVKSASWRIKW